MKIFSEEEFEFNIEQETNFNKDISDENEEDSEETIIHFTSNLAVNITCTILQFQLNILQQVLKITKDQQIQYSLGSGGQSKVKCPFFGNIYVIKDQRKCQGITICPHIDNQIKLAKHCNVDFDSDIFKMIKDEPCPKTLSNGSCAGLPVLRKIKENTLMQYRNNSSQNNNRASQILQCKEGYFIGCSLWSNGDSWHRFIPIPESCNINIIRRLLNGESFDRSLIQDKCCTVLPNTTQKKFCLTFPHLDEHNRPYEAQLENMSCEVKFYRFTPVDLIKCPFVVLVCIGEHTHPPPPPSHVPEAIQNRLKSLIETTSRGLEHATPRKLISVTDKDQVEVILEESEENGALASLNFNYSNIYEEDWHSARENTNTAESAHADTNREGVQMSLLLAIKKGKRLDEHHFVTCEYQNKYNIPKTGRSSGPIAKATKTVKRLENSKRKKQGPTNKQSSSNSNTNTNNKELNNLDIEIAKREKLRKLKLIDYEFQHQKEILDIEKQTKLANLRAQELANIEKEKSLGIYKESNN
ncbi:11253_t:CDS:2 [Gigaspora margarita]|uniref:11253_t:CDS:1 n=1 Tax=Gigaspora margarita TaxID=4874 RepID=A0ABM8W1E8_GIGMA|nr:11253_t:CDS:2 [Gigaspora margarita]